MMAKRSLFTRKLRARERGAALIMVLGSLTILSVMLAETQDEMSTEFASALSDRDQESRTPVDLGAIELGGSLRPVKLLEVAADPLKSERIGVPPERSLRCVPAQLDLMLQLDLGRLEHDDMAELPHRQFTLAIASSGCLRD